MPNPRNQYQSAQNESEAIFTKAKEQNIEPSSAKAFLATLSDEELTTLEQSNALEKPIDIDAMDDDEAYDLVCKSEHRCHISDDQLQLLMPPSISIHIQETIIETVSVTKLPDPLLTLSLFINSMFKTEETNHEAVIDKSVAQTMHTLQITENTSFTSTLTYHAVFMGEQQSVEMSKEPSYETITSNITSLLNSSLLLPKFHDQLSSFWNTFDSHYGLKQFNSDQGDHFQENPEHLDRLTVGLLTGATTEFLTTLNKHQEKIDDEHSALERLLQKESKTKV
jgi:hypothetical protein